MTAQVAQWKKDFVENLTGLIDKNNIIGVVNIEGIPAPQMQKMRKKLKDEMSIIVSRKRLIKHSLNASKKKNLKDLEIHMDGQVGIVLTETNPFKLYKIMKNTQTESPAKGGEIAPEDIIVKEGDTPFKPGPIVGDLQKAGIKAAIERGKIVIKKTSTIVKEGEVIPRNVANVLTKLEIYPLTVGLHLTAVYEKGTIYDKEILDVDTDVIKGRFVSAVSNAQKIAIDICYITNTTIEPLIKKAYFNALNLAIEGNIITKDSVECLLLKAQQDMLRLRSLRDGTNEQKPAIKEEEKKEDKKKDNKDKEEKEEVSEEEAVAGLGALFG